jgi:hypothetical protein
LGPILGIGGGVSVNECELPTGIYIYESKRSLSPPLEFKTPPSGRSDEDTS